MPNHWYMSAFDVPTRGARNERCFIDGSPGNPPDEDVNSSDEYRVNSRQGAVEYATAAIGDRDGDSVGVNSYRLHTDTDRSDG